VLSIEQAADIRRQAIEANETDARNGLIPRRCDDPAVLARVAAIIRATTEGVVVDAKAS
jgi:hypothetical protein